MSVINMLEKKDKLPAVAFMFSRKRIEENTLQLNSVDLTSSAEKSHIHLFCKKSIDKLKPADRKLPQVLTTSSSSQLLLLQSISNVHFYFVTNCEIMSISFTLLTIK